MLCLVLMLLVASFSPPTPWAPSTAARDLAAAAAAEKAADYAEAARYYRQALGEAPASEAGPGWIAEVRLHLAKDYFLLHRYTDSVESAQAALGASARLTRRAAAQARLIAGLDDLALGRLAEAIANLQRAMVLDPQSGTARLALGDAYARSNQFENAASEYRRQLRLSPAIADAWYKLGIVYSQLAAQTVRDFPKQYSDNPLIEQLQAEELLKKGDDTQALHALLSALRASPYLPGLHADLGTALFDLGYTHEATRQFAAELAKNPESPAAQWGLAEADALTGNWQEAFKRLAALMNSHPRQLNEILESPSPKPLRDAWRQGRLKVPAQAEGKLWTGWLRNSGIDAPIDTKPAGGSCPSLAKTASQVPGVWLTASCYETLRRELERSQPLSVDQMAKLAEADFRLGDYEGSRAEAERLRSRQPGNAWAAWWLAHSYDALAYASFEKVASISPNSARVHEMLAQTDADHFQWNRAEREYKAAIRLAPDLPDLHAGLGTVYWQAGQWLEAEHELTTTLMLDPASAVANYELGDALVEQHQWKAAIPCLQKAIQDEAVAYRARLDLAQAEAETGNAQQAIEDLLPIAAEDRDGVLHYRLAILYRQLGETARAQSALAQSQHLRQASARRAQSDVQQAERELRGIQLTSQSAPRSKGASEEQR